MSEAARVGLVLALAAVAGCGSGEDAPIGKKIEEPRTVFLMPHGYGDVAVFCDGPVRVYVSSREGSSPTVVAGHPACSGESQ